jgi:aspartate-semialdehyde dehydrogenase
MVGSVLMDRLLAEDDLRGVDARFFSTSAVGLPPPCGLDGPAVGDSNDLEALGRMDAVVSCQGGSYTERVHPELRRRGWKGYWIDAASTLRTSPAAVIVLDPVNRAVIDDAIARGCRDLIGGNCTVSLMLMGIVGLLREGWVEWISTMTYQAASGAGAAALRELVEQMRGVGAAAAPLLDAPESSALELERAVTDALRDGSLPTAIFGAPLAASLIPWIDRPVGGGQTREEWKGHVETNKILGLTGDREVPVDGLCVRVGSLRCHSAAVTMGLTREVPLDEIEAAIAGAHEWVEVVPNEKAATLARLSPAAVSGTLTVPVGRVRKLRTGPRHLGLFTVGDQLLWGAAEPLRRALRIVREHEEPVRAGP